MNKLIKILHLMAIGLAMPSCADEEVGIFDSLEVRLVAYDEMNVERTSFDANEDIKLGLSLVNSTSSDIEAGTYFDYCSLLEIEEYLLVYKRTVSDTGSEIWQPVGKPYVPPIGCPTIPLPVIVPANGEQMVVGMRWSNNSANSPLGPGKYYTSLSHSITVDGQVLELSLRLDFEVR